MSITITITADSPELLAERATWLATRLGSTVIAEQVVKQVKAKKTAQPEVATDNTGSSASSQTQASPPVADVGAVVAPPTDSGASTVKSEGTATLSVAEIQKLAALKAKKAGPSVIKGLVADTGFAQIADIDEPAILASLVKNLEAL